MMITEEFSFPIITNNNVVHLTVLPPLWRISSVNHEPEINGRIKRVISRSFSEVEEQIMKVEKDVEAEEKMDMLWEDFNEELLHVGCSCNNNNILDSNSGYFESTAHHHHRCSYNDNVSEEELYDDDIDEAAEVRSKNNMRGLEIGAACGKLIPAAAKKKKLKFIVKMMKKLFLVQNMARIKKRGGPN